MNDEYAACGKLAPHLQALAAYLDQYLEFRHPDAMSRASEWQDALRIPLPAEGIGLGGVISELGEQIIANGSPIPKPGCSAFITTGASSAGVLASLAASVAAPQRVGLTAFHFLEELSLNWLAELFELPPTMQGIYSSGGSVANLLALGAARQQAYEALGIDPAECGLAGRAGRIYASAASHRTLHRACAVLGLGRGAVSAIATDDGGRMCPDSLRRQLERDAAEDTVPVAVVATAGTTATGAIDPLQAIAGIAREHGIWLHVDGAYGLPGMLDPRVRDLYDGLSLADSIVVDPHKWLGAPVGIGATFVRDRQILQRAFSQGFADYLEGSCHGDDLQHSMASLGVPYGDMGVELSAPSRGVVVWSLIREIGAAGLRERVCRHNTMARRIAERAREHPKLELVQAPTLSICCFRYVDARLDAEQLNALNRHIHRQLLLGGVNMPSTAVIEGRLAIRPCFIGARADLCHADALVEEVIAMGSLRVQETLAAPGDTVD